MINNQSGGTCDGARALAYIFDNFGQLNVTKQVTKVDHPYSVVGGSSDVYQGSLQKKDGKSADVAVKRIRLSLKENETFAKSFAKEIYNLSNLSHENIIAFEGYTVENGYLSIVVEWADSGTVTEFIRINKTCDLIRIASGIADGLKYLHDRSAVHADLKSDNILMDRSGTPKLSDFGQSRASSYSNIILKTTSYDRVKGTSHWLSYELLEFLENSESEVICTQESDMWAFGMVLYEMISGNLPYAQFKGPFADFSVMRAIRKRLLPPKPIDTTKRQEFLWCICLKCWDYNPKNRLTAEQAHTSLQKHILEADLPLRGLFHNLKMHAFRYYTGPVSKYWLSLCLVIIIETAVYLF